MNDQQPQLKLYVWEHVLSDYTDGIMFALARSPEHARELIAEKLGYLPDDAEHEPRLVDAPEGFAVYGGG